MRNISILLGKNQEYKEASSAFDAAKSALASKERTDVVILADGGEFTIHQMICLSGKDVGHPDSTLTVKAATGEKPTFTGLRSFSGADFRRVEGTPYFVYRLPDSARDENGAFPIFRDFYVDGRRARLVQMKENSFLPFDHVEQLPWDIRRSRPIENKLYLEEKFLKGITLPCDPMPELWLRVEWQIHALHILSIDYSDKKGDCVAVRFPEEEWKCFSWTYCSRLFGRAYWLCNHLSFLTEENDFYYDRSVGEIYYLPCEGVDLSCAVCGYPTVQNLFTLDGFSHLCFENIRFTGTTSNYVTENGYEGGQCGSQNTMHYTKNAFFITNAAVFGENCTDIRFDGCEFFETGNDAIYFRRRSYEISVTGCRFERIGAAAFRIGSPLLAWDDEYDAAEYLTFDNNYVNEAGLTYTSSAAVMITHALHVSICHNTLKNTCYSAVSVGWSWALSNKPFEETKNLGFVEIAYNYVDNFMYCMRDGGAIYTLGGNAWKAERRRLNCIHHNYIVVGETSGEAMNGYRTIYHDNGSSHWHDYDNVILAREDNPPRDAFVIGGSMYDLVERTYILDYSLPTPRTVHRPDGEGNTMEVEELDTDRSVKTSALPEKVICIIEQTGAVGHAPTLPVPHIHARQEALFAKNTEELVLALAEAKRLLEGRDTSVCIRLAKGDYTLPNSFDIQTPEDNALSLCADADACITSSLSLENPRNFDFSGLIFSAPLRLNNAEGVAFKGCRFSAPTVFSGRAIGISVENSRFESIDGDALSFGDGLPHSDTNVCESIRILGCRFENISGRAIGLGTVKKLTVRKNSFKNIGLEAVKLGVGEKEVTWSNSKTYNVLSVNIGENRIENYMMNGDGAAIATTGGNRAFYHSTPFNVIEKNYILPGADTGKEGSYSVFYHGGCASQWHTRFNLIAANPQSPAVGALCRFVGAYASWADENTVLTDTDTVFCDPSEILPERDLHDKLTYFVKPTELSEKEREHIENAGC